MPISFWHGTTRIATALLLAIFGAWVFFAFGRIGGETFLMRACKRGHPIKVVQTLLIMGSNPNAGSKRVARQKISVAEVTPLMFAAIDGRADVARLLLARGADPNRVDSADNSALCAAMYSPRSNVETVQVLVQGGARIVGSGNPALACLNGAANEKAKAKFLLDHGATVSTRTLAGEPVFIFYSRWGFTEAVQLLIQSGADVDVASGDGRTALMEAAENGRYDTVRALLEANANPCAKDGNGQTALELAKRSFVRKGSAGDGSDSVAKAVMLLQSAQDVCQFRCNRSSETH